MAEVIDFKEIVRARGRRRERQLTTRCLEIMNECLARSRAAYDAAPLRERSVWTFRIRRLEELIDYTANLL